MGRSVKKGPFTDTHLEAKVAVLARGQREEGGAHLVAALHDSSGVRRTHDRGA